MRCEAVCWEQNSQILTNDFGTVDYYLGEGEMTDIWGNSVSTAFLSYYQTTVCGRFWGKVTVIPDQHILALRITDPIPLHATPHRHDFRLKSLLLCIRRIDGI